MRVPDLALDLVGDWDPETGGSAICTRLILADLERISEDAPAASISASGGSVMGSGGL